MILVSAFCSGNCHASDVFEKRHVNHFWLSCDLTCNVSLRNEHRACPERGEETLSRHSGGLWCPRRRAHARSESVSPRCQTFPGQYLLPRVGDVRLPFLSNSISSITARACIKRVCYLKPPGLYWMVLCKSSTCPHMLIPVMPSSLLSM